MAYDREQFAPAPSNLGKLGGMIDYSGGDITLGTTVKAVVVCAAGNVVYYPAGRLTGTAITMTDMAAGTALPHVPGKIVSSGTTATLCTVED